MDETELQLEALKEAQKKKNMQELDAARNSSLTNINREVAIAKPQFVQQRNDKNVASQISKLNFATFSERRNGMNAGITNQGELSRGNRLNRDLGNIDTAENTFDTGIANRRLDVDTTYNTSLASSNMGIDTDYAAKLLEYREQLRREKLAKEEQLRQEQVARDEATLAYQRAIAKANTTNGNGFSEKIEEKKLLPSNVKNIGNNTIAIQKPNGEYATFTITENTPDATLLKWGQQYGVDLSGYIS